MTAYRAAVASADRRVPGTALHLAPGQNLRTGTDDFGEIFPDISSLESDLLTVASAVYACDLAFKRGEREEITRDIELTIPVVNHQAFSRLKDDLELLLWTLSHDNWSINFVRDEGQPEPRSNWPSRNGVTILFSGGVDSFVGTIEALQGHGVSRVQLVSHITGNPVTQNSQNDLAGHLASRYGQGLKRVTVRTGGRNKSQFVFPSDSEREETQRTRTFMFLSIAALAARRTGQHELVLIAENGQMAIHLPLSPARIGAFSTHTAHPEFVASAINFFSKVLDTDFTISNPFLYATKGEVVTRLDATDRAVLAQAVSCWRGARVPSFNHCGECIPCLVRRIAFESNGIVLQEYKRDLLSVSNVLALPENDEGKRNLVEFAEFSHAFLTTSDAQLVDIFPDLINSEFDTAKAIAMYRRSASEACAVLSKYPGPAALLPPIAPPPLKKQRKGGN